MNNNLPCVGKSGWIGFSEGEDKYILFVFSFLCLLAILAIVNGLLDSIAQSLWWR